MKKLSLAAIAAVVIACSGLVACSSGGSVPPVASAGARTTNAGGSSLRVSSIGDGVASGAGLSAGQDFVTVAAQSLGAGSITIAAIAGETSAQALTDQVPRIDPASTDVVVTLGTADAQVQATNYATFGSVSLTQFASYKAVVAAIQARAPSAKIILVNVRNLGRGDSTLPGVQLSNITLEWDGQIQVFNQGTPPATAALPYTVLDLSTDSQWYLTGDWQAAGAQNPTLPQNGYLPTASGAQHIATALAKLL